MDGVSLWVLLAVLAAGLWFAWRRTQSSSGSSASARSTGGVELARIALAGGDQLAIAVDHGSASIVCRRERERERKRDRAPADVLAVPCPGAGAAGARICLAPSGRLALVALHSGQGEEGYVVLGLDGGLTRLVDQPYVAGEAAAYCFDADEARVVMALPFACTD